MLNKLIQDFRLQVTVFSLFASKESCFKPLDILLVDFFVV